MKRTPAHRARRKRARDIRAVVPRWDPSTHEFGTPGLVPARPFVDLSVDYASLELRTLAWMDK